MEAMLFLIGLVFPLLLLVGLVGMERVERPLRQDDVTVRLHSTLDSARPEELESLVAEGYRPALDRYWRRRRRRAGRTSSLRQLGESTRRDSSSTTGSRA
jgi:hypothetical protein